MAEIVIAGLMVWREQERICSNKKHRKQDEQQKQWGINIRWDGEDMEKAT